MTISFLKKILKYQVILRLLHENPPLKGTFESDEYRGQKEK